MFSLGDLYQDPSLPSKRLKTDECVDDPADHAPMIDWTDDDSTVVDFNDFLSFGRERGKIEQAADEQRESSQSFPKEVFDIEEPKTWRIFFLNGARAFSIFVENFCREVRYCSADQTACFAKSVNEEAEHPNFICLRIDCWDHQPFAVPMLVQAHWRKMPRKKRPFTTVINPPFGLKTGAASDAMRQHAIIYCFTAEELSGILGCLFNDSHVATDLFEAPGVCVGCYDAVAESDRVDSSCGHMVCKTCARSSQTCPATIFCTSGCHLSSEEDEMPTSEQCGCDLAEVEEEEEISEAPAELDEFTVGDGVELDDFFLDMGEGLGDSMEEMAMGSPAITEDAAVPMDESSDELFDFGDGLLDLQLDLGFEPSGVLGAATLEVAAQLQGVDSDDAQLSQAVNDAAAWKLDPYAFDSGSSAADRYSFDEFSDAAGHPFDWGPLHSPKKKKGIKRDRAFSMDDIFPVNV